MTVCEECQFNVLDEENEDYYCSVNFDEDELERFLQGGDCPFYKPYNEYKMVQKQN